MSLAKRIIPCLDVDQGRVVKGVQFAELHDAGSPVEVAKRYNDELADEITFLDISASSSARRPIFDVIEQVARSVFIPLTVGGGVRSVADVRDLLNAGADKVSMNTAAIHNPDLINEASDFFGSQAIVVAIDAKRHGQSWQIYTHGGNRPTGIDAIAWARTVADRGAGEILLTSMDQDGMQSGFDLDLVRAVSEAVNIPVIASGGVGCLQHLIDGITLGGADAVLAASVFHFGILRINEVKAAMQQAGIPVRTERTVWT